MYLRLPTAAALSALLLGGGVDLAAAPPASVWTQSGATPGNTNINTAERTLSAATIKTLHLTWAHPGIATAVATPSRIFAISRAGGSPSSGSVLVLARSGQVLRRLGPAALGLTGTSISRVGDRPIALAYAAGRLVVADTTEVQAYNPETGRRIWRVAGGAQFLTVASRVVYTGKACQNPCGPTNSYAIDLVTGRVRWVHAGGGGRPILAGGRLFQTGSAPNSSQIYDALSGRRLGTLPASILLADQGGAYGLRSTAPGVGCRAWIGRYTLGGRTVWQKNVGLCSSTAASLGYGTLFVTSDPTSYGGRPAGGWVTALSPSSGAIRWSRHIGSIGGISLANGLLFVLREYTVGEVVTLAANTGRPVAQLNLRRYLGVTQQPFAIAGGRLYIADGQQLLALGVIPRQPQVGH